MKSIVIGTHVTLSSQSLWIKSLRATFQRYRTVCDAVQGGCNFSDKFKFIEMKILRSTFAMVLLASITFQSEISVSFNTDFGCY